MVLYRRNNARSLGVTIPVPVAQVKNTKSVAGAVMPGQMPNSFTIHRLRRQDVPVLDDAIPNQNVQRKVLRTICPDAKGLIATITNICYKHELNIVQNNEFVDHRTGRFFMRTELEGIFNDTTLLADLDSALPEGSVRELHSAGRRRIVILVTKEAHCLGDLLMKSKLWRSGRGNCRRYWQPRDAAFAGRAF